MFGIPSKPMNKLGNNKIKSTNQTRCSWNVFIATFKGVGVTDYALNHKLIDEKDLDLIEKPPYNLHLSLLSLHLDRNPDALRISNLQSFLFSL